MGRISPGRQERIPSRGNSMCKSSLKHIIERANISFTNVEFGFYSQDYIALFKYKT